MKRHLATVGGKIGAAVLSVVTGVAIWFITQSLGDDGDKGAQPPASVRVGRPATDVITYEGYLETRGLETTDISREELRAVGVLLETNLVITGHEGENLGLRCVVLRSGRVLEQLRFDLTPAAAAETTTPCWLPLPRTRRPREYKAQVIVEPEDGSGAALDRSRTVAFRSDGRP